MLEKELQILHGYFWHFSLQYDLSDVSCRLDWMGDLLVFEYFKNYKIQLGSWKVFQLN